MKAGKIPLLIKLIIIHTVFVLLHYLYDWFPNSFTALFSGVNESVYQHMKIGFFSYIIYGLIEYLVVRKFILSIDQHFFSRLFSATFFPLVILVIYLISPLMFGQIDKVALEVVIANLALLASSLIILIIEGQVENAKPARVFRVVVVILFLVSLVEFIVFTNHIPWFDIFAIPPGY